MRSDLDLAFHRQWSWPLWLPVQFFGIFPDSILVDNDSSAPWSAELEQKLFSSAVGEPLPHRHDSPVSAHRVIAGWVKGGRGDWACKIA